MASGADGAGPGAPQRMPPGAHRPRTQHKPSSDDFQVELQGQSIKQNHHGFGQIDLGGGGLTPANLASVTGYLPSGHGGYVRPSRNLAAYSTSARPSGEGKGDGLPMYHAGGEQAAPGARGPSTVRLVAPSQGVFGLRENINMEVPRTGVTLTTRPHVVQTVSALDKVLLASSASSFGTGRQQLGDFDGGNLISSAEAFQLPPVKERPTLSPSLLDGLKAEATAIPVGSVSAAGMMTLNKGTFRMSSGRIREPVRHAEPRTTLAGEAAPGNLVEELPEDVPKGVVTGEDAVIYFVSGGGAHGLVLYCNYARKDRFAPYDLQVVGMANAEPEHFAISYGGVTHIVPGEETEVMALHEWVRQKRLYSIACRLPFFGKHTLSKAFWQWMVGIRNKRFESARNKLNVDLLAANELFGPSLRRIARAVASITMDNSHIWRRNLLTGGWELMEPSKPGASLDGEEAGRQEAMAPLAAKLSNLCDVAQSYPLLEFQARRAECQDATAAVLEGVMGVVKSELEAVGSAAIDEMDAAHPPTLTRTEARAARYQLPGRNRWKAASVSQQRSTHRATEQRQALSIHQGELLGRFLRLCDVMLVAGLVDLGRHGAHTMMEQLGHRRKYGLIQVFGDLEACRDMGNMTQEAAANSVKIVFSPSRDEVMSLAESLLSDMLAVVAATPRPLYFNEMAEFYDPFAHNKPPATASVMDLLEAQIKPTELQQQIVQHFDRGYVAALCNPSTTTYTSSAVPYAFASAWDRDAYAKRNPSPSDLSTDLKSMRTWHQDLNAAKNFVVAGLVHLDCTRLRTILMGPALRTLTGMALMLHDTYGNHITAVMEELQRITDQLRKRPAEFQDFAAFVADMGPHLSSTGEGRKRTSGSVSTAKALLFLLQPHLAAEELHQMQEEMQMLRGQRLSEETDVEGSEDGSCRESLSGSPEPHSSSRRLGQTSSTRKVKPTLVSNERHLLQSAELVAKRALTLNQRARQSSDGLGSISEGGEGPAEPEEKDLVKMEAERRKVLIKPDIAAEQSKERMESQAKQWSDLCKYYKEYESSCRDAATFVTSFKPVMSSALLQASLSLEGSVQNLIVRARREHLIMLSTPPSEVLEELRAIAADLEGHREQSVSFHEHQDLFNALPLTKLSGVITRAQAMLRSRITLWGQIQAWGHFQAMLEESNVLVAAPVRAEDVRRQAAELNNVVELLEERHVDSDARNPETVTPGEAALIGEVRGIVGTWEALQPLVEKLCHPAMQQHHLNLLLLDIGLLSSLPRLGRGRPGAFRPTGLPSRLAKEAAQASIRSEASSKLPSITGVVSDRSQPAEPNQAQQISFAGLLRKASATEDARQKVEDMCTMAKQEQELSDRMEDLRQEWDSLYFLFSSERVFGVHPFANLSAIEASLEEGERELETVATSPYLIGVMSKFEEMEGLLTVLQARVADLETCQNLWLFLSRVVLRPETGKCIPDLAERFDQVGTDWKMLGLYLQEGRSSLVSATTGLDPALGAVAGLRTGLEGLKRDASSALLGPLRQTFPRFCFADDTDVLHALAYADSPHLMTRTLLQSVFPGVMGLRVRTSREREFEREVETVEIESVIGVGDEEVKLIVPVRVEPETHLATVMGGLEEAIRSSMAELTHRSLSACAIMKGPDWVASFPLQSTVLVDAMVWTDSVSNALRSLCEGERGSLRQLLQQSSLRLETMSRQVQTAALAVEESLSAMGSEVTVGSGRVMGVTMTHGILGAGDSFESIGGPTALGDHSAAATPAQVVRGFKALIQAGVYHRSVVENLIANQVVEPTDFEWQRQLRYYWDRDFGTCLVNVADTSTRYGFEYQGAEMDFVGMMSPKLFSGFLGSAASLESSPVLAVSGRSADGVSSRETSRAMATAFGRPFFSVTCTEQMDCRATASVLRGFVESQAWGHLDGCQRLMPEVVSQLAQQIHSIRQGLISSDRLQIGGLEVQLPHGYREMAPSFVLMLDAGQRQPDQSIPWQPARDDPMPEAVRWLTRRVEVHCMALDLPVEAALRMYGLGQAREASVALATLLKLVSEHFRDIPAGLLGIAAARAITTSIKNVQDVTAGSTDAFEHLLRASQSVLLVYVTPAQRPTMQALIQDVLGSTRPNSQPSAAQTPTELGQRPSSLEVYSAPTVAGGGVEISDGDLFDAVRAQSTGCHSSPSVSMSTQPRLCAQEVASAALAIRHATMHSAVTLVVGGTGVGKTRVRQSLSKALRELGAELEESLLYPGSLTMRELLGRAVAPDVGQPQAGGLLGLLLRQGIEERRGELRAHSWAGTALLPQLEQMQSRSASFKADGTEADSPPGSRLKRLSSVKGPQQGVYVAPLAPQGEEGLQATLQDIGPGRMKWLVVDGSVSSDQARIMLPLLSAGRLCHSPEGGAVLPPPGTTVLWETDSMAGISPADACASRVVHLTSGLVESSAAVASRVIESLHEAIPSAKDHADSLMGLPVLLDSTIRLWQRFHNVAVNNDSVMASRAVDATCSVCDIFIQILRDSLPGLPESSHSRAIPMAFVFSLLWGLGSRLTTVKQRQRLEKAVRQNAAGSVQDLNLPEGSMWDYRLGSQQCEWVPWTEDVADMLAQHEAARPDSSGTAIHLRGLALFPMAPNTGSMKVIVPTPETVACQYAMSAVLACGRNPILVGPSSSGKSLVLQHLLAVCPLLQAKRVHSVLRPLHSRTTAAELQGELVETLIQVHPQLLRPSIGKVAMLVVDDVHVPIQASSAEPPAARGASRLESTPHQLEWIRQVADSSSFMDFSTGARVAVNSLQLLGAATSTSLLEGTPCVSLRFLRHWQEVAIYDSSWKASSTPHLDPKTHDPVLPPLKNPLGLLEGIAHRLMLACDGAVSTHHADSLAKELSRATLGAAKALLTVAAAVQLHPPGLPAGCALVRGEQAGPPEARGGQSPADRIPPRLTFERLERILQRVRTVILQQVKALEANSVVVSMLRKQVAYVWLHEAARELTDELAETPSALLRQHLVDVAAEAFPSFNDGIVNHPARLKGMPRGQWAALLAMASEMDGWQIGPLDLEQAHGEMETELADAYEATQPREQELDWPSDDDSDDELLSPVQGMPSPVSRRGSSKGQRSGAPTLGSQRSIVTKSSTRRRMQMLSDSEQTWEAIKRMRLNQPSWSTCVSRLKANLERPFELGNVMLVGPSCSGRVSAAHLASQRLGWEPVVLRTQSRAHADDCHSDRSIRLLSQVQEAVGKILSSRNKAVLIVPRELSDDDTMMALLQEIIVGWQHTTALLLRSQTKAEALASTVLDPREVLKEELHEAAANISRAKSIKSLSLEIPDRPDLGHGFKSLSGTQTAGNSSTTSSQVLGTHDGGTLQLESSAGNLRISPAMSAATAKALQDSREAHAKTEGQTAKSKSPGGVAATAKDRLQVYHPSENEGIIAPIQPMGCEGSVMFGTDRNAAIRLLRAHSEEIEEMSKVARARRPSTASKRRTSEVRNRRWDLAHSPEVGEVRARLRCILVASEERQKDLAIKFPLLLKALQVMRLGMVDYTDMESFGASWVAKDALVALLPPQLKAAHDFSARPPKSFGGKPAHQLRNPRDVFDAARAGTFGSELVGMAVPDVWRAIVADTWDDDPRPDLQSKPFPAVVVTEEEDTGKDPKRLKLARLSTSVRTQAIAVLGSRSQTPEEQEKGPAQEEPPSADAEGTPDQQGEGTQGGPSAPGASGASPEDGLVSEVKAQLDKEVQEDGLPPGSISSKQMARGLVALHYIAQQAYEAHRRESSSTCVAPVSKIREVVNIIGPILSQHRKLLSNGQASVAISLAKLVQLEVAEASSTAEVDMVAPQLEMASENTADLLVKNTAQQRSTDSLAATVLTFEEKIANAQWEQQKLKTEAEQEIAKVHLSYESATEGVLRLTDDDIDEIRGYHAPPGLVHTVMEAVCILFHIPLDWRSAKQLLAGYEPRAILDPSLKEKRKKHLFKAQIINYDLDSVDDSLHSKLRYFRSNPSFNPKAVAQVSEAAKSLCTWVLAVERHATKKRECDAMHKTADEAQGAINELQKRLASMQRQLETSRVVAAEIESDYKAALDRENHLKACLESLRKRTGRCERLRLALSDIKVHWNQRLHAIEDQIASLQGDALLAACSVVYLGPLPVAVRHEIIDAWREALINESQLRASEQFRLHNFMAIRDRGGRYIPRKMIFDSLQRANLFMISLTRQAPLLVDPDGEGIASVRQLKPTKTWLALRFVEPHSTREALECIVAGGNVLLRLDEEDLDLERLLGLMTAYQDIMNNSREMGIEGHRLFLFATSPNPHLPPLVYELFNVIRCTVDTEGLEKRALTLVLQRLHPVVEQQKRQLVIAHGSQTITSEEIDTKILRFMSKASAALWDDKILADTIVSNAQLLDSVRQEIQDVDRELRNIRDVEDRWRGVAQIASELFLSLAELSASQPGCVMSWPSFARLLKRSLHERGIQQASGSGPGEEAMLPSADGQSPSAVEAIVASALFQQVEKRLPECWARALGVVFALRVLERVGHISVDERDLFVQLSCTRGSLDCLRRAGVDTGPSHPLLLAPERRAPASETCQDDGTVETEDEEASLPGLSRQLSRVGSHRSVASSSSLSTAGVLPPSRTAGAGTTVAASLTSELSVAAAVASQRNNSFTLSVASRQASSFFVANPGDIADLIRPISRAEVYAPRASVSATGDGGPMPFNVTHRSLLAPRQDQLDPSLTRHPHMPLFGGKPGAPGPADPSADCSWLSPALLADLQLLEDKYPEQDAFAGIVSHAESNPSLWQAVSRAKAPPAAIPAPWGSPAFVGRARSGLPGDMRAGSSSMSLGRPRSGHLEPLPGAPPQSPMAAPSMFGDGLDQGENGLLSDFQRVVLCLVLCPERSAACCDWLLSRMIKREKLGSQMLRLQGAMVEIPSRVPILLHSWGGEEPTSTIQQLAECIASGAESPSAKAMAMLASLRDKQPERPTVSVVSLGQGQSTEADEVLREATAAGHWVVVRNAHMDPQWCARAAEGLASAEANVAPTFRLWLATRGELLGTVPPALLNSLAPVALEPTRGVYDAAVKWHAGMPQDLLTSIGQSGEIWRSHAFGLALVMSLVTQAGAGGSTFYNQADLFKGLQLLSRVFGNMSDTRFLDYSSLQRLLRHLVFEMAAPGGAQVTRLNAVMARFVTHDILSVHYPVCKRDPKSGACPLPAGGLGEVCQFLQAILPAEEAMQHLLGAHPRLGLLEEGQLSKDLAGLLQGCWGPRAMHPLLEVSPFDKISGGLPPFMHPDHLGLWLNEMLNAIGISETLARTYGELIGKASTSRSRGPSQSLLFLQAMLVEVQHLTQVMQTAASDMQGMLSAMLSSQPPARHALQVARTLACGLVPERWMPDGLVPSDGRMGRRPSLVGWRSSLQGRLEFLRGFKDCKGGQPSRWDLSVLAYPEAIFAALRRSFAAESNMGTPSVGLKSVVMQREPDTDEPPVTGIYVTGLRLVGAKWSRETNALQELDESQLFCSMPTVWLVPTHHSAIRSQSLEDVPLWDCPLYVTPDDASLPGGSELLSLKLETLRSPDTWTRAGVYAVVSNSSFHK